MTWNCLIGWSIPDVEHFSEFSAFGSVPNNAKAMCSFKALGSTNKDVFRREAEGLILLSVATIFAAIIDLNLAYAHLNVWRDGITLETGRFIFSMVSYFFNRSDDCCWIWFPAKKPWRYNQQNITWRIIIKRWKNIIIITAILLLMFLNSKVSAEEIR